MKGSIRLIGIFTAAAFAWLAPGKIESAESPSSQATAEAPVEFIYGGITPNNEIAYEIKVNTAKPIEEVHMKLKEMDASGKVLFDGDLIWQNIQHSTRQPIEQGRTYEATMMMPAGAVKAECSLKEVFFKDNTRSWVQGTTPPSTAPIATVAPSVIPGSSPVTASPPPAASGAALITQGEAESFARSVYRDLGQGDVGKVLAYFDTTVDYYSFGRKDKAFIAEQLRKYFASYPIRLFSVGEVKLQAPPHAGKMSVSLEVRYTLRTGSSGAASTGRSQVEWDLVKRDGVPKIVRFAGTSYPDPTAPASP
jgi:hypothetical protein